MKKTTTLLGDKNMFGKNTRPSRYICTFYYDHRLKEIEVGLPVQYLNVYLGHNGDYYLCKGNNTGLIDLKDVADLIEKFGKPIDIDFDTLQVQNEFEDWLGFIEAKNMSFAEIEKIKEEIDSKREIKRNFRKLSFF
jgi:hypothetical protein